MTGIPTEVYDRIGGGPAAASTLSQPESWFINWATGNPGAVAGVVVNEHTALGYATLYSCVSLIAGSVASLPLKVYRKRAGGGADEATDHPAHDRLQFEFNPNTAAMTGREAGVGHLLTWGNSYAQIVTNKRGDLLQLQPLGPDRTTPRVTDRGLVYDYRDRATGEVTTLGRDEVLHVPGLTFDALVGLSTVRVARNAIRTGMTQEKEAEQYVANGIRPPGAIKLPVGKKFATTEQATAFQERFRKIHAGPDGVGRVPILEDGADWTQIGIDPVSAQLLESRKFSAVEICGLYRVPPFMVGLVEKTTAWGTGVEEMTIGFVVYCLLPTLRRIEQEYNRKLFAADRELYCEHVLSGLLRGDALKRSQALEIMSRNGIVTVNEWRRLEGMNPVAGGNVRYFPLNMGRVDEAGDDIPPPAAAAPDAPAARAPAAGPRLAPALRRVFAAGVSRCLRKEAAEAVRAAGKPAEFVAWLDRFYARHADMVAESTGPALDAWAAAHPGAAADPAAYADAHVARSRADLLAAAGATAAGLPGAVERTTQRWLSERVAEAAASLQPGGTHAV